MKTEKLTSTFKMILVSVFVVFTISLCSATSFECHYYAKSLKSLEIYCDLHQNPLPGNCTRESSNPLIVTHLKIEGCDQRTISAASEKYPNVESLNISHSGYSSLDRMGEAFEKVTIFDASSNELSAVPTSFLSKFPQLNELRLAGNKIEKISNGDFKNVNRKLRSISLANNRLKSIDDDAFASFEKLLLLDLSANLLKTFPKAVFTSDIEVVSLLDNPQLTTINCKDLLIRSKPSNRIHFSWELITTFDGRCDNNWSFDIANRDYDEFIRNSMDHTTFYCNFNKRCFKNMRYFVTDGKSFGDVGKTLSLLGSSIEKIEITGKHIDNLDATAFERFQNLSKLSLSNTNLWSFSFDLLSKQRNLSHLDISDSNVYSIGSPQSLKNFTQLTYLNVSMNSLKHLTAIVTYLPSSVRRLDLSENQLGEVDISQASFSRLNNLEELDLHDIEIIPDGMSLDTDMAYLPRSLKRLNLHRTNLRRIKNLDRKHFPVLTDLDVSDNAIDCGKLEKLRSEFEDADTFRSNKCKTESRFWMIFLAVLAISIILIIVILEQTKKFRKPRRY